jgi:circadian clock protein KaiB
VGHHKDSIAAKIHEWSEGPHVLKLFVAGSSPRSLRAIRNVARLCETDLAGRYQLEVVDIYKQPELAGAEQIVAVPTLIKKAPGGPRRVIGDLSETELVRTRLGI